MGDDPAAFQRTWAPQCACVCFTAVYTGVYTDLGRVSP